MSSHASDPSEDISAAALEWHVRIEAGDLTQEEHAEFEAWHSEHPSHADAYDRATTVWAALGTLDRETLGEALFRKPSIPSVLIRLLNSPSIFSKGLAGLAVACAVLIVTVIGFNASQLGLSESNPPELEERIASLVYSTAIGEQREIVLSDGSNLTLGPATEVEARFSSRVRRVTLKQGAAVFDVARDKDRPFIVAADAFEARVLGTVFDVRKSANTTRLSVVEGRVEASHPFVLDGQVSSLITKHVLTAGQQVVSTGKNGLSPVSEFNADQFASWRSGRLSYVGASLEEMIADANRYSQIPILIDEVALATIESTVTFSFEARATDAMLTALPSLFPVTVDVSETEILIQARD